MPEADLTTGSGAAIRARTRTPEPRPPTAPIAAGMSTTTQNVRQVAHVVGYDNEASFSKAFSRLFARPPGE